MAFKLDKQALRNYLKLSCEYELHIVPNTEVSTTEDHGKNYMKVRPPMVRRHLFYCQPSGGRNMEARESVPFSVFCNLYSLLCNVYFPFCAAYISRFVQRTHFLFCAAYIFRFVQITHFLFCAAYIFRFVQRTHFLFCAAYIFRFVQCIYFPFCAAEIYFPLCK